jgi:hypothetical protein
MFDITQKFRWISSHDTVGRHVFGDNAAGSNNGVLTDCGIAKDRRT